MSEEQYTHVLNLTKALWRVTDLFSRDEGVLTRHIREKASEIFSCMAEFGYSERYEHEQENIQAKIKSLIGFLEIARLMKCVKPINIAFLSKEYGDLQHFFKREFEEELTEQMHPPHSSFMKEESLKNSPLQSFSQERNNKPVSDREKRNTPFNGSKINTSILQKTEVRKIHPAAPSLPKEETQKIFPAPSLRKEEDSQSGLNDRQKTIITHMKEVAQAKVSDFYEMFSRISTKTVQRDLQDLVTKNILRKEGEKRWTMYSIVS